MSLSEMQEEVIKYMRVLETNYTERIRALQQ